MNNQTRFVQNQKLNLSFYFKGGNANSGQWGFPFYSTETLYPFWKGCFITKSSLECGTISLFAIMEVWSFEFGALTTTWFSQIKVNMNIFRVISPKFMRKYPVNSKSDKTNIFIKKNVVLYKMTLQFAICH